MKLTPVNKDFMIGYLKGAQIDGCIVLLDGWENKSLEWMASQANLAEAIAKEKILNGEILKSETMTAQEIAEL